MQDMAPYIPLLLPGLQQALIDPLPDVRATAAKAVGILLGGMGAEHAEDLMPWLLNTLKSEVKNQEPPQTHDSMFIQHATTTSAKEKSCCCDRLSSIFGIHLVSHTSRIATL